MSDRVVLYQLCHVVLICYDVSDEASFRSARKYKREVDSVLTRADVILVGCKADLRYDHDQARITYQQVTHFFV